MRPAFFLPGAAMRFTVIVSVAIMCVLWPNAAVGAVLLAVFASTLAR